VVVLQQLLESCWGRVSEPSSLCACRHTPTWTAHLILSWQKTTCCCLAAHDYQHAPTANLQLVVRLIAGYFNTVCVARRGAGLGRHPWFLMLLRALAVNASKVW